MKIEFYLFLANQCLKLKFFFDDLNQYFINKAMSIPDEHWDYVNQSLNEIWDNDLDSKYDDYDNLISNKD